MLSKYGKENHGNKLLESLNEQKKILKFRKDFFLKKIEHYQNLVLQITFNEQIIIKEEKSINEKIIMKRNDKYSKLYNILPGGAGGIMILKIIFDNLDFNDFKNCILVFFKKMRIMLEDNKKNSHLIFNYYNIIQKFRSNEIFYRKDLKYKKSGFIPLSRNCKGVNRYKRTILINHKYVVKIIDNNWSDVEKSIFPLLCNDERYETYKTNLKILCKKCENLVNILGIYNKIIGGGKIIVYKINYINLHGFCIKYFKFHTKYKIREKILASIIYQVLIGIKYLSNNDLIFGNIKTFNILINKNGTVKISDFLAIKDLFIKGRIDDTIGPNQSYEESIYYNYGDEDMRGYPCQNKTDFRGLILLIIQCLKFNCNNHLIPKKKFENNIYENNFLKNKLGDLNISIDVYNFLSLGIDLARYDQNVDNINKLLNHNWFKNQEINGIDDSKKIIKEFLKNIRKKKVSKKKKT